jgi:osmotically-inducible protein OsmY
MADQFRKGYEDESRGQSQGRGGRDDDSRYGNDFRSGQLPQSGAPQGNRGWRNQGDGRFFGTSDGGSERTQFGGGSQDSQYGSYSGSQYGGMSSQGRGYPESDFLPHRVGSSERSSEQGGGEEFRGGRPSSDAYGRGQESNRSQQYGSGVSGGYSGGYSGGASSYNGGEGGGWNTGGAFSGGGASFQTRESYAGRGPKDYKRSDDRIREDVSERLEQDHGVDASEITVEVRDGEVVLSGTVSDRDQKRRAEECVESCSGVRDVTNNLRVNRQERSGSAQNSTSMLGLGGQKAKDADASTGQQNGRGQDAGAKAHKGTTTGTAGGAA